MPSWSWPLGRTPAPQLTGPSPPRPIAPRADAAPAPAPAPAAPAASYSTAAPIDRTVAGVHSSNSGGDPIGRLGPAAQEKLRRLRTIQTDLASIARDTTERQHQLRESRRHAADNLERVRQGGPREGARPNDIALAERELTAVVVELEAVDQRLARLAERRSPLPSRLNEYLRSVPGQIEAYSGPPVEVKPAKGQTPLAAVAAARQRLAELQADLHQIRSAPLRSAEVKRAARRQIEAMALRGTPSVMHAIEIGREIVFPSRLERTPAGTFDLPDTQAFLCWLHEEEIIARIEAEIDELSDDAHALSDDERAKRETVILGQILATERNEEALIELAVAEGAELGRREDADPRAVLGLSASLPAPARP